VNLNKADVNAPGSDEIANDRKTAERRKAETVQLRLGSNIDSNSPIANQ